MKNITPAEIRELIGNLRSHRYILNGASPDDAADALEYLLRFVEWRPIAEWNPSKGPGLGLSAPAADGKVHLIYDLPWGAAKFVLLPPPSQQNQGTE